MARWTDIGALARLRLLGGAELVPDGPMRVERSQDGALRLAGAGVRDAVRGIGAPVVAVEVRRSVHEAFERLHWGLPAGRAVEVRRPQDAPDALVELGRLVRVELVGGADVVPRGGPVWLVTSAALDELWLVAEGGVAPESPAGRVAAITYDTQKGDTAAWWRHPFRAPGPELARGQLRRGRSHFTLSEHGILR